MTALRTLCADMLHVQRQTNGIVAMQRIAGGESFRQVCSAAIERQKHAHRLCGQMIARAFEPANDARWEQGA